MKILCVFPCASDHWAQVCSAPLLLPFFSLSHKSEIELADIYIEARGRGIYYKSALNPAIKSPTHVYYFFI